REREGGARQGGGEDRGAARRRGGSPDPRRGGEDRRGGGGGRGGRVGRSARCRPGLRRPGGERKMNRGGDASPPLSVARVDTPGRGDQLPAAAFASLKALLSEERAEVSSSEALAKMDSAASRREASLVFTSALADSRRDSAASNLVLASPVRSGAFVFHSSSLVWT